MTAQTTYFGKYQKHVTIASLFCYQLLMVPLGFLTMYSLIVLDWNIITPLVVICVIQFPFKKSQIFVKFVQKYIIPTFYFKKFTRIVEEKFVDNEKTMFGFHPHSIFCYSILLSMNRHDKGIPDFIGLGSRFGFNAPILGLILRLWGCSTVYGKNLKQLMQKGKNIGLVPGGYQQASLTTTKQMRLYLQKRKGFIKYALKYGYTIRPVINFGENKAFQTLDIIKSIKLFLNKFKMPTVFFLNRKYLFFVDPNLQLTSIIGKGIRRQPNDSNLEPTEDQINRYHSLYVEEVIRIYNKYKHLNDNKPLVIM